MIMAHLLNVMRQAKGDPERLTLATVDAILSTRSPGLRDALEAAAVLRSFNAASLGCLLTVDPSQVDSLTQELASLPIVEPYPARGGWNVHQATRLAMRRALCTENPTLFQNLSARAATCSTGATFADRIEAVYHRLSSEPAQGADELDLLYRDCDESGQREASDLLATALEELRAFPLADEARGRVLLILGSIRLYRHPLATTEALSEEAFEILKSTGPQNAIADSQILRGLVFERNGHREDALKNYLSGQTLMRELAATASPDKRLQRDLASTGTHIGRIYRDMERFDDALQEFQGSQSLLLKLIASEPEHAHWKRELAIMHNDLGRVYESRGEFDRALEEFRADQQIYESLVAAEPENLDLRGELAVCHNNIGRVFQRQGSYLAALADYEQYRAIMKGLTAIEPANLLWQRELAVAYLCVGNTYGAPENIKQEGFAAALDAYEAAGWILRGLIEIDPRNARTQMDLYLLHNRRGDLYLKRKSYLEARKEFESGRLIAERLHAIGPSDTDYWRALSVAYYKIGRACDGLGEYHAALAAYRSDVEIAERLVALQSSNLKWTKELETSRKAIEELGLKISSET